MLNGSMIIEEDKTGDHEYIRFENGIQICLGTFKFTTPTWNGSNPPYGYDLTTPIPYAKAFIDYPIVFINNQANTSIEDEDSALRACWVTKVKTDKDEINSVAFARSGNWADNFKMSYIAIGHWK